MEFRPARKDYPRAHLLESGDKVSALTAAEIEDMFQELDRLRDLEGHVEEFFVRTDMSCFTEAEQALSGGRSILERVRRCWVEPTDLRFVPTPDGLKYTPGDLLLWLLNGTSDEVNEQKKS